MITCDYDKHFTEGSLFEICQPLFSEKCEFQFVMVLISETVTPCLFFPNRVNLKKYRFLGLEFLQVRHPDNDWTLSSGCVIEKPTDPPTNIGVNYCGVLVATCVPLSKIPGLSSCISSEYIKIKVSQIGERVRHDYANIHIIDNFTTLIKYLDWISPKCTITDLLCILGQCLSSARFIQEIDLNDFFINRESNDHPTTEPEKGNNIKRNYVYTNLGSLRIFDFYNQIVTTLAPEFEHPRLREVKKEISHQLILIRDVYFLLFEDDRVDINARIHEAIGLLKVLKMLYGFSGSFCVKIDQFKYCKAEIVGTFYQSEIYHKVDCKLTYCKKSYGEEFKGKNKEIEFLATCTQAEYPDAPYIKDASFKLFV